MDMLIAGKRALVTGGSKGIGRAAAMSLAAEGCDVLVASRDAGTLEATAAAIRGRHQVRVETMAVDLSAQEGVERLAEAAGPVDILVNNAGAIPSGSLLQVDNARWREAWDLKVFGFISLTRALYPLLAGRGGVVVNVVGVAGEKWDPAYIAGSTGNAALMAFTRAMGMAAPKDGMRVVGINPGPVATERMERLLRARAGTELGDAERWHELTGKMPFGRAATPEEIGDAVVFLASPRSAYTTGTILTIDGGK